MDPELERRVFESIKSYPNGVSDKDLSKDLPKTTVDERVKAINSLLQKNRVGIYKLSGGKIIYKVDVGSAPDNLKTADNEEKIIYRIIEEAANKGIWIRDIRSRSNLLPKQLDKVLRSLENSKMIKSVKTVNASKKKVYMLYNLEPDSSLTGGAWYSDQEFESDFVDKLNQYCYKFLLLKKNSNNDMLCDSVLIHNKLYATAAEVCDFINNLGISNVKLKEGDIQQILTTLLYDGKVDKKLFTGGVVKYKAVESPLLAPGFVRQPCGICPVFRNCEISSSVNPKACPYLKDWLTGL